MSARKDGGPAFARPGLPTNWAEGQHAHQGMTMRQYYKAKALAGLLAPESATGARADLVAEECGKLADAMLAEDEEHAKK